MKIAKLVRKLKDNDQDMEFYPTSDKIISIIKTKLNSEHESILDCGAGNGATLSKLTQGKKYAIEKSQILVKEMPSDIFIIGCDFYENVLIDKKVDVVFCNPPYSEYKEWAIKIINEANAAKIFLVIPDRWKNQPEILATIKDREAKYNIIGNTDFLDAERAARCNVDIIEILLTSSSYHSRNSTPDVDPFFLWVQKEFPINTRKEDKAEYKDFSKKINELVPVRGLILALVELYNDDLFKLQLNFKAISELDQSIFNELQIDFKSVVNLLQRRIIGLKEKYWRELFKNLNTITDRLTKKSREKLLKTLTDNISVDFQESNIYSVVIWAIKNANSYFDSQLIDVFMDLSDKANLVLYKSNQSTWGKDKWRFREEMREGKIKNFGLDYRCVISCHNTFNPSSYGRYEYENGIHNSVNSRLNDILTIAHNLSFLTTSSEKSDQKQWEPGKEQIFLMNDGEILMSVRVYMNGNLHIKFNQKFLRNLNVEFGRLKGWLRSSSEASEELNIPEEEAKMYFKTNYVLEGSSLPMLEYREAI